jgi:hypothetical protein
MFATLPKLLACAGQSSVEIGCCTNQREMCKRLRKIAEMPTIGAQFLGVKADMVGISQKLFEQQLCFL